MYLSLGLGKTRINQRVMSTYVSEFKREVEELVINHKESDVGQIVYVDYVGRNVSPTNYYYIHSGLKEEGMRVCEEVNTK